jgi:hypothetical protein
MQHALVGEQGIFSMGRALADQLRRLLMKNEADGVRANDLQKTFTRLTGLARRAKAQRLDTPDKLPSVFAKQRHFGPNSWLVSKRLSPGLARLRTKKSELRRSHRCRCDRRTYSLSGLA